MSMLPGEVVCALQVMKEEAQEIFMYIQWLAS